MDRLKRPYHNKRRNCVGNFIFIFSVIFLDLIKVSIIVLRVKKKVKAVWHTACGQTGTIFFRFLARKAPNSRITRKSLLTAATHTQWHIHAKVQVSTPSGLAYSVRKDRKKRVSEGFWGAKRPIYKL